MGPGFGFSFGYLAPNGSGRFVRSFSFVLGGGRRSLVVRRTKTNNHDRLVVVRRTKTNNHERVVVVRRTKTNNHERLVVVRRTKTNNHEQAVVVRRTKTNNHERLVVVRSSNEPPPDDLLKKIFFEKKFWSKIFFKSVFEVPTRCTTHFWMKKILVAKNFFSKNFHSQKRDVRIFLGIGLGRLAKIKRYGVIFRNRVRATCKNKEM